MMNNPQVNTSKLENQIDEMVYKLYQLTYEEVKIIEPEFAMRQEDYDALPAIEAENIEPTATAKKDVKKKRKGRQTNYDVLKGLVF